MRSTRVLYVCFLGVLLTSLTACAPRTFVRTTEPTWASIEIRKDVSYDKAWETVVDLLVKRFELTLLSKGDGYMRTNWLYTWTGKVMQNYRVRLTVKFSPDRTKIEVKSEAEYGGPGRWIVGYDTRLVSTVKADIMGTIGRTTR